MTTIWLSFSHQWWRTRSLKLLHQQQLPANRYTADLGDVPMILCSSLLVAVLTCSVRRRNAGTQMTETSWNRHWPSGNIRQWHVSDCVPLERSCPVMGCLIQRSDVTPCFCLQICHIFTSPALTWMFYLRRGDCVVTFQFEDQNLFSSCHKVPRRIATLSPCLYWQSDGRSRDELLMLFYILSGSKGV